MATSRITNGTDRPRFTSPPSRRCKRGRAAMRPGWVTNRRMPRGLPAAYPRAVAATTIHTVSSSASNSSAINAGDTTELLPARAALLQPGPSALQRAACAAQLTYDAHQWRSCDVVGVRADQPRVDAELARQRRQNGELGAHAR